MKKTVFIAGAGLAGLASGLRLAKKGFKVQIAEKNTQAGGRLNQIKKDGFTFDTGPSFFSMSYEFEEFAQACNIKLPFEYAELDPLYTVNFSGSDKSYFLYKDIKKLARQFEDIEPDFENKMNQYLESCGKTFHDTIDVVIKQNFDSLIKYFQSLMSVNPGHVPKLFRSFWKEVNRHFSSDQARQIISLVAFFLGRTPFDTSAIYTLLSYTEFKHDGYYNVKGGMYKIVEGLVNELEKEGAEILYNTEICDFKASGHTMEALIDQNGREHKADIFLINADAAVFRGSVLKKKKYSPKKLDKMSWTMGYLTIYLGLDCKLPQVHHHNYFLGSNYQRYADKILKKIDRDEKPYYYVNILSKHNPDCAPENGESVFIVCPVPNLLYKDNWEDKDKIAEDIISDFSTRIKQDISKNIVSKTVYTPKDWQEQFNLHRGSGLGLSHSIMQIGAFRPANFDKDYNNLYYAGASTVPGAGLPMAVISSKLATERIEEHLQQ